MIIKSLTLPLTSPCEGQVNWTDRYWEQMRTDPFFLDGRTDYIRKYAGLRLKVSIDPLQPISEDAIIQDVAWIKQFFSNKDHVWIRKVWVEIDRKVWDEKCGPHRCFAYIRTVP